MVSIRRLLEILNSFRGMQFCLVACTIFAWTSCEGDVKDDQIPGLYRSIDEWHQTIMLNPNGTYIHKFFWHGRYDTETGTWSAVSKNSIALEDYAYCRSGCDVHQEVLPGVEFLDGHIFIILDPDNYDHGGRYEKVDCSIPRSACRK